MDLDSVKVALNTAREALASALPWNGSISALVGLMMKTNYMVEDLGGNSKRAAILLEFTDYVFGRNALNWENNQSFLSTDKLVGQLEDKVRHLREVSREEEVREGRERQEEAAGRHMQAVQSEDL